MVLEQDAVRHGEPAVVVADARIVVAVTRAGFVQGEIASIHSGRRRVVAVLDALAAIQINGIADMDVLVAGERIAFVEGRLEPARLIIELAVAAAAPAASALLFAARKYGCWLRMLCIGYLYYSLHVNVRV